MSGPPESPPQTSCEASGDTVAQNSSFLKLTGKTLWQYFCGCTWKTRGMSSSAKGAFNCARPQPSTIQFECAYGWCVASCAMPRLTVRLRSSVSLSWSRSKVRSWLKVIRLREYGCTDWMCKMRVCSVGLRRLGAPAMTRSSSGFNRRLRLSKKS